MEWPRSNPIKKLLEDKISTKSVAFSAFVSISSAYSGLEMIGGTSLSSAALPLSNEWLLIDFNPLSLLKTVGSLIFISKLAMFPIDIAFGSSNSSFTLIPLLE